MCLCVDYAVENNPVAIGDPSLQAGPKKDLEEWMIEAIFWAGLLI